MDNHTTPKGSEIDKDSVVSTHVMLPLSYQEYLHVFGEAPEGFADGESHYIGLWVTKSDLRRGENRWRSLGKPDPLTHDDTLFAVQSLSAALAGEKEASDQLSEQLDDMCQRYTEANERIEALEKEKTTAETKMLDAQRSTALHESRVNAKAQTIEALKADKDDLHRDLKAERLKVKAHEIGKRKRNILQKAVAKIFMIS